MEISLLDSLPDLIRFHGTETRVSPSSIREIPFPEDYPPEISLITVPFIFDHSQWYISIFQSDAQLCARIYFDPTDPMSVSFFVLDGTEVQLKGIEINHFKKNFPPISEYLRTSGSGRLNVVMSITMSWISLLGGKTVSVEDQSNVGNSLTNYDLYTRRLLEGKKSIYYKYGFTDVETDTDLSIARTRMIDILPIDFPGTLGKYVEKLTDYEYISFRDEYLAILIYKIPLLDFLLSERVSFCHNIPVSQIEF